MAIDIYFLSADKPIQKKYELDADGKLVKHPYPFVYEVTSHHESIKDIRELHGHLNRYAATGDTLVKGIIGRQLVSESRAGSTDPEAPTQWICLDLDGIENYQSVDAFLADIGIKDVDYVLQWSSSMGIENQKGFRCHIFMMLDRPIRPQILKNWLTGLNLDVNQLASQLDLTKTGNALRWPLDITTCQSDKLLYIAPPALGAGVKDPYKSRGAQSRISFEQRGTPRFAFPAAVPSPDTLRTNSQKKIAELRQLKGMPKQKPHKYQFHGQIEYMTNPGEAAITEMKEERGFIYFNLNVGDSWAYYHPLDNPEFIFNFKGEPVYRTRDLLPSYWAKLTSSAASGAPDAKGRIYLAFREFTSGVYWNGFYDTKSDDLQLYPAKSETQLRHFMKNNGIPMGEAVPDWTRVFEPDNPNVIDRQAQTVNVYNPSQYFKETSPRVVKTVPSTIRKVVDHVLGSDPATVDHFLNWLACVVQTRRRVGTAWVLQGTQGTGKGLLFHNILAPLFGQENVTAKRMEELESEFTGFMENKFLVFIDEIETGRSLYHTKVTAKLKNLIVEPYISIRNMYRPPYMAPNFSSMIFASNKPASVEVAPDDRRFNVGGYQENKIQITSKEIDQIPLELESFYAYLYHYPADPHRARTPLVSAARSTLIDINRTAIDSVSDALDRGDLEFFWDQLPSTKNLGAGNALLLSRAQAYRDLIVDIVNGANGPDPTLTRDDLNVIMEYTVGNMPMSPNKFTSLLKHHRIHMRTVWKHGRSVRGISVPWQIDAVRLASMQKDIAANVV